MTRLTAMHDAGNALDKPRTRLPQRIHALYGVLRKAWEEYERDHAAYFAAAMVYYALFSLVPLLLLLLAAPGLLLRFSDFAGTAEQQVLGAIEAQFGAELRGSVQYLFDQMERESVVATVVSLVGMLFGASALFRHLRRSFRAIWKYAPPLVSGTLRVVVRTTVLEHAIAFVMVLTGGVLLLAALVLIAVTQWLGALLNRLPLPGDADWLVVLPSPILIVFVTFALLLKFLPPTPLPWRHVWLASVLCTATWMVGAEIVVLAGALFGANPSASSAIGGLMVAMIWMHKVSQVLFFGAEVCKVVAVGDDGISSGDLRPQT
jgi:membrane protein